jgi:uncharacterized lipoprotein YmbA
MTNPRSATFVVVLLATLGAGCSLRETPPRTYILSAAGVPTTTGPHEGPVVGVGPVVLPAYLDRSSIVVHEADGEVRLSSSHQWAEPLKDGVTRVVAENLAVMIPTDAALVYPWRSPRVVTYRVTLEIFRFDGTLGGPVVLNVRWRLLDKDGNELALRTVTLDERPVDSTYAALVASHGHLLAAVSRDIATAIHTHNAG